MLSACKYDRPHRMQRYTYTQIYILTHSFALISDLGLQTTSDTNTPREENLHWNLYLAISLMANSLYFKAANQNIFHNLSMMAYITKIQK